MGELRGNMQSVKGAHLSALCGSSLSNESRAMDDEGKILLDASFVARALSRFPPDHLCVDQVWLTGRTLEGNFVSPRNAYYKSPSPHLNTIDYMLCLNQFAYLLAAATIHWRLCDAVTGWTDEDLSRLRAASQLQICSLHMGIHRPSIAHEPVRVCMELCRGVCAANALFFRVKFRVGASAYGQLTAAMLPERDNEHA